MKGLFVCLIDCCIWGSDTLTGTLALACEVSHAAIKRSEKKNTSRCLLLLHYFLMGLNCLSTVIFMKCLFVWSRVEMNSVFLNITEESRLLLFVKLFHNDRTSLIFVLISPIFLHTLDSGINVGVFLLIFEKFWRKKIIKNDCNA